jgi:hypothetical protein
MNKIGDYEYPTLGTFEEALEIAKDAIQKYGGIIPNEKAAEKLGYKIKDAKKISGPIYKRLGDLASFGLFSKIRGGYQTTDLAEKALDPYNSANAEEGKAEAVRKIPIVSKAFTEWKGEIPAETAFPAKVQGIIESISWNEAQKHADSLRKLFIEVFPYLKIASNDTYRSGSEAGGEPMGSITEPKDTRGLKILGELRTEEYGIIKLKDKTSIAMARMALESLEQKINEEKDSES